MSEPPEAAEPVIASPPIRARRSGFISRLLHGTGAGAVAYGLNIASNLLLLPLYLHYWSVSLYGEWMALDSIVNYLANLDFGLTVAAVNASTIAYAGKDWKTFKRIQGTAWTISITIAAAGAAAVLVSCLLGLPVSRWLHLTVIGPGDARLVFCGLAVSLLASIPGRQVIAVYISIGEFPKYQWLYNAYALFTCVVTAIALIAGAGPVPLAMVTAAIGFFPIAFTLWILYRRDPHLIPRMRDAGWSTARRLAAPTGQVGLSLLATILTQQGPVVILSRALGGPAVALFTSVRTVSNAVRGTVALFRAPLRPEVAAASALPEKDALRRLFRIAVGVDTFVAISLSAILWSMGDWLISFWSHGRIKPDAMLLRLLLVVVVLEGFLQVLSTVGWATNRFKGVTLGQLVASITSLILAFLLVGRFGPSAIPMGAIVPLLVIMTPLAVHNAHNEATVSLTFVVWRLVVPFVVLAAFSAVLPTWIENLGLAPLWLSAAISSLVTSTAALLTVGSFFLTRGDRVAVRERIITAFFRTMLKKTVVDGSA